jgi:hypothetical protein
MPAKNFLNSETKEKLQGALKQHEAARHLRKSLNIFIAK